ncbi:MAG: DNA repair protein RadA [Lachnospiraceae bacterium]|nr:DNA repair protein RadA [Lachnospiraceae bacterium]
MAKAKTVYVCTSCGAVQSKWMGQCPACKSWNVMEEREETTAPAAVHGKPGKTRLEGQLQQLRQVQSRRDDRISTGMAEMDRVLGGGIVRDSVTIIAAKPGAGKSTLMLQMAQNIALNGCTVLYVSGEESESQLRSRAERILHTIDEHIWVYATAHMNEVLTAVGTMDPDLVILDSIQTFFLDEFTSRPGTPTQIMECTNAVMKIAKDPVRPRAVMMAGQLTKEDELAGVRSLEHMVDTVLFMEADPVEELRVLSSSKNRFGSTGEMGFFTMEEKGLEPIDNPSRFFMTERSEFAQVHGSALSVLKEGTRPMILEIESLISHSYTPYPSRISECLSRDQMGTLISILEQRGGIALYDQNVVIKSTGGLKLNQQSVNLAVIMSLVSSALKRTIANTTVFIGDVGLTGELKKVPSLDMMVRETARLGFKKIYVPKGSLRKETYAHLGDTKLMECAYLKDVIRGEFGDYRKDFVEA